MRHVRQEIALSAVGSVRFFLGLYHLFRIIHQLKNRNMVVNKTDSIQYKIQKIQDRESVHEQFRVMNV